MLSVKGRNLEAISVTPSFISYLCPPLLSGPEVRASVTFVDRHSKERSVTSQVSGSRHMPAGQDSNISSRQLKPGELTNFSKGAGRSRVLDATLLFELCQEGVHPIKYALTRGARGVLGARNAEYEISGTANKDSPTVGQNVEVAQRDSKTVV